MARTYKLIDNSTLLLTEVIERKQMLNKSKLLEQKELLEKDLAVINEALAQFNKKGVK